MANHSPRHGTTSSLHWLFLSLASLLIWNPVSGEELSVEQITTKAADSIVTLSHKDRQGNHNGMGTGFVVDPNGLIATSLHVIGEARPIEVRFRSGASYPATAIHAWDRKLDLAVIRIDANDLKPLPLGDSDALRPGQAVVAVGNPMGLEHSVVTGVVSGIREFDHSNMIQLAIPIEPGNSGGPLLDRSGQVHGLLNLKSTVTQNLGFATPIAQLKPLLEKPNSVPIERWLRIGALNADTWQATMGAHWSQLTGRIKVSGTGDGFGGRSLCLRTVSPSQKPYEIEVSVRLSDESGAAGLVFCSDGSDKHYGFYPSNGQIRLTRFDGPNVFSWNILHQIPTPHYRRGDWNQLRIRHTADRIMGFVNGYKILDATDKGLGIGQVGLAKFRNTEAEFKGFRMTTADALPDQVPSENNTHTSLAAKVGDPQSLSDQDLIKSLSDTPEAGQLWLEHRARQLESEAQRLRLAGQDLHRHAISLALSQELAKPDASIDLLRATLLIAKHDNPELEIEAYLDQVNHMAGEISAELTPSTTDHQKLDRVVHYLFKENGFHGSYFDYRNNANSYLNNVIDDREGLPITLSVLFLEVARRVDLPGLSGFPLPYHFMVKYESSGGDYQLIDPFNTGERLTYAEANDLVARHQNAPFRADLLESASKRDIINRMLRNLLSFTQESQGLASSLPYLDLLITVNPDTANYYLERAWIHLRTGNTAHARADLEWVIEANPPGINISRVREALESL